MATDATRKLALQGVVSALAAVTAGGNYFYSYNGAGQVELVGDTDDARLAKSKRTIRVMDGVDEHTPRFASPWDAETTVVLELILDVLLRGAGTQTLPEEMSDVLSDITFAISAAHTLGGVVSSVRVFKTDAIIYDTENNLAAALVRLQCKYDYQPGVTA